MIKGFPNFNIVNVVHGSIIDSGRSQQVFITTLCSSSFQTLSLSLSYCQSKLSNFPYCQSSNGRSFSPYYTHQNLSTSQFLNHFSLIHSRPMKISNRKRAFGNDMDFTEMWIFRSTSSMFSKKHLPKWQNRKDKMTSIKSTVLSNTKIHIFHRFRVRDQQLSWYQTLPKSLYHVLSS